MNRIAAATAACALALGVAACSHTEHPGKAIGKTHQKPAAAPAATKASPPATPALNQLGTAVQTDGAADPVEGSGGGVLQITPTSAIYMAKTFSDKPANGQFLIVTVKDKAMAAVAAAEEAPMGGGGWTYVAPDGQAITTLSGNATNVVPDGFEGGGSVDPGTYQWSSDVFDISPKQAGGTLSYKDGTGKVYRWKVPATTTGPEAAKVQASLK